MIFGFNTEVVQGALTFHVQSELRARETVLDTQVFVSGRCIGKFATPIPDGIDENAAQEMLRGQHRRLVAAAREGTIAELLEDANEAMTIHWHGGGPIFRRGRVRMSFVVSASGQPIEGADLTVQMEGVAFPVALHATTNGSGQAEVSARISESSLQDCSLRVEATCGERIASRRYRLQKGSAG